MGMLRKRGSALSSLRASRPSFRGIFKSNNIKSGRGTLGRLLILAPPPQVVQQLLAVADDPQVVRLLRLAQRLLDQEAVVGIVVGHEDGAGPALVRHHSASLRFFFAWATGSRTSKVEPLPGVLWTEIWPP